MKHLFVWMTAGLTVLASGCAETDEDFDAEAEFRDFDLMAPLDPIAVPTPNQAFCNIVVKNHGTKAAETNYLPNVLACEAPGGADLEMLKAQAVAARSYAYYHMATAGKICNGQGCQVFSCGRTPSALHKQAVRDTSGVILSYNDNLTVGFYVAGDSSPAASCVGNSGGVGGTEQYVTYNEGKTGSGVKQTRLGYRNATTDRDYGQNRGALSQWGAHCLVDRKGYDALDVLHYYYGEDIELVQTQGSCIEEVDIDLGGGASSGEACGVIGFDDASIIDNDDDCFRLDGPSQYWRTEHTGEGGTLHWTKSTATTEHNTATWFLNVEASGDYLLEVHIDPDHTTADRAKYEVVDATLSRTITVDQTRGGWIKLGVFALDADEADQQVKLTDAIGVKGRILQADALRVTPAELAGCDEDEALCQADDVGGAKADAGIDRGNAEAMSCNVVPGGGRTPLGLGLLLLGIALRARRRRGSNARRGRAPRR